MNYILLTVWEFVGIIAGVTLFSMFIGLWVGRLLGKHSEQMKQFYNRTTVRKKYSMTSQGGVLDGSLFDPQGEDSE